MNDPKVRRIFPSSVVYKNLKESNYFSALSIPSFLRDWIMQEYSDEEGNVDYEAVGNEIKRLYPRKDAWIAIKDKIILENEPVEILTRITVDVDIATNDITFSLPMYDLLNKHTLIEPWVWEEYKNELLVSKEVWGIVELGYLQPGGTKNEGKISLASFKNFCPYEIDLEYYKEARALFSIEEWIDVLLGAIDYNPAGYKNSTQKLTLLSRLLPFVEKRLNLVELAPKGTGKSYLFGRISKYGWLASGGRMSRARMFYDLQKKATGLVSSYDYIAFDEVQTISFTDPSEMKGALKGYLESGECSVGDRKVIGDAGVILLGNINQTEMNVNADMFRSLPDIFYESALIDRFHGFIQGWKIPRMNDDLKAQGWALNSEYFTDILHLLRDDLSYRTVVNALVYVPPESDTRDVEAIKRLCTGFLKLLFPHVQKPTDISEEDFWDYCLYPSMNMRNTIKKQLAIIDPEEFGKKLVPSLNIKKQM